MKNNNSIINLFNNSFKKNSDKIAIIYKSKTYTYNDIECLSNRIANKLISKGCSNESFALILDKSPEFIILVIAIWKIGGRYIPIDMEFPMERIQYIIKDSNARYIISNKKIQSKQKISFTLQELFEDKDDLVPNVNKPISKAYMINNFDVAYIIYTSGSTGMPKGVQITNNNLISFMSAIDEMLAFKNKERFLSITTVSFDISVMEMFYPLLYGHTLVVGNRRMLIDMEYLKKSIKENNVTVLQATPLTWELLINSGWKNENRLKILCGGEKLEKKLSKQLYNISDEVWNLYGPTETTIWSSIHRLQFAEDISIGTPLKNNKFYIFSDDMKELTNEGELYIGGESVSIGYINNEKLTYERFIKNPFNENEIIYKTGDIVKYENNQYYCLGRKDFQVKINGHRIELEEIEKQLEQNTAIDKTVVVADKLKNIYAFVIGKDEHIEDLREQLENILPIYMIPKKIFYVDFFPLTFNKKIDKNKLLEQYIYLETKTVNNLTDNMVAIWKKVLKQKIDINKPYYDYEIDSLTVTELCIEMEKIIPSFSFKDLIQYETISEIVKLYNKKKSIDMDKYIDNKRVKKILIQNNLKSTEIKLNYINNIEEMMLNYSYTNPNSSNFNDVYIFKVPYNNIQNIKEQFYKIAGNISNLKTIYIFGEKVKIYSDKLDKLIKFECKKIESKEKLQEYAKNLVNKSLNINEQSIRLEVVEANGEMYWSFIYHHIRLDENSLFDIVDKILKNLSSNFGYINKNKIDVTNENCLRIEFGSLQKSKFEKKALIENVTLNSEIEYHIINVFKELGILDNNNFINYVINIKKDIGNNIDVYSIKLPVKMNISEYSNRKKYMLKQKENKLLFSYNDIRKFSFDIYNISFFHVEKNNFNINVEIYNENEKIILIVSIDDNQQVPLNKLKSRLLNLDY